MATKQAKVIILIHVHVHVVMFAKSSNDGPQ